MKNSNTKKEIDLVLIRKLFEERRAYKPYLHIRESSRPLSESELKVLKNIRETTEFEFNQVTINYNNKLSRHRHANVGKSLAMLLGNFTGGALCIENGKSLKSKNEWFSFDGGEFHWVEPFEGERFSIILYNR